MRHAEGEGQAPAGAFNHQGVAPIMRIMFIVHALAGGGAERVVARIASALVAQHEVHVVVNGRVEGEYPIDARVQMHVLEPKLHRVPVLNRVPGSYGRSCKAQLRKLKRDLRIDVAVSFLTASNYYNAGSSVGERTVISIRSTLAQTIPSGRIAAAKERYLIRRAARRADGIVAVSRNVAAEQVEDYGADARKVCVVYNPIDADAVARAAAQPIGDASFERFRAEHGFLVASAGRLTWQKAQWHLIRAFAQARSARPDAGLLILGAGEEEQHLREVVRTCGVADHVYFAGFQPNPFAYLGASDVFAMTSMFEGFSNAMVEALACGLPLVSTDCNSGPRELLAPDTDPRVAAARMEIADFGMLVPVCSGDAGLRDEPLQPAELELAHALKLLMDDSALRMRLHEAGLRRVQDFTVSHITAQWAAALGVAWDADTADREVLQ